MFHSFGSAHKGCAQQTNEGTSVNGSRRKPQSCVLAAVNVTKVYRQQSDWEAELAWKVGLECSL